MQNRNQYIQGMAGNSNDAEPMLVELGDQLGIRIPMMLQDAALGQSLPLDAARVVFDNLG